MPISRSTIADIENRRRRYVTTAELSVLAWALAVPPVRLLYPDLPDGSVEAVPGVTVSSMVAVTWFSGEATLGPGAASSWRLSAEEVSPVSDDFAAGGARLWAALHGDDDSVELTVLVREACRITDRLDALADAVTADGLLSVIDRGDGTVIVKVDGALAEARQQANALRLLLGDIAKRRGADDPDEEDGLADL